MEKTTKTPTTANAKPMSDAERRRLGGIVGDIIRRSGYGAPAPKSSSKVEELKRPAARPLVNA